MRSFRPATDASPPSGWTRCAALRARCLVCEARCVRQACIDQTDIQTSLRLLPVFVMACDCMLILFGDTYSSRLWCVWELYTLFAISPDFASGRVVDITSQNVSMIQRIESFAVKDAQCYSSEVCGHVINVCNNALGLTCWAGPCSHQRHYSSRGPSKL